MIKKIESKMTIVVHDGRFHADETFAIATLLIIEPNLNIIRTRNKEKIAQADVRVDVGRKHNPETGDFDHHQKEGAGLRNNIPYASAGLIWKYYGKYLADEKTHERIDKNLFQPIDAIDNGIKTWTHARVEPYDLHTIIKNFHPPWYMPQENIDEAFMRAVNVAKQIIINELAQSKGAVLAKAKVIEELNERKQKEIIILKKYHPFEEALENNTEILYAIFPTNNGWSLKALRKPGTQFDNRKDLPASWAGKEDEELQQITGVTDAIFCHKSRFVAVAKSFEGIQKLAQLALENNENCCS